MLSRSVAALLLATARPAAALFLSSAPAGAGVGDFWPEARGPPTSYGVSPYTAPRRLTNRTLAWTWSNGGPVGKYSQAAHSGLLIDGERNIYLASWDGVRKLSSEGKLLWHVPMVTWRLPAMSNGRLYITDNGGIAYALNTQTGAIVWAAQFTKEIGTDISGVAVVDGVMVAESGGKSGGGASRVAGLDSSDGRLLWDFKVDSQLWNMMPMSAGNGTFIFQDSVGGVYRLRAKDGHLLWKSGYSGAWAHPFTDGMAMVKDGLVYAVHSSGDCCHVNQPATLRAYDLGSGAEVWRRDFTQSINSQPVVGRLGSGAGLSSRLAVVVPVGVQPNGNLDNYVSSIGAFDAKTGKPIWEWTPPSWLGKFVASDDIRLSHGTICLPNPYGSPSIDGRGTVYVGHYNGMLYAIRDDNGDGTIQDSEVSRYDTGAAFSHGGVALAPGMLAIPSCDTVYVFRE